MSAIRHVCIMRGGPLDFRPVDVPLDQDEVWLRDPRFADATDCSSLHIYRRANEDEFQHWGSVFEYHRVAREAIEELIGQVRTAQVAGMGPDTWSKPEGESHGSES